MQKLTNVSRRPETVVLAKGSHRCYTGRRGQELQSSITIRAGETVDADDALLSVPKVRRLLRAGRFLVKNVLDPKPEAKKKSRATKKSKAKAKKKG